MALTDLILGAIRVLFGKLPPLQVRTYGPPGRVLADGDSDHEAASHDIANDLDASFPDASIARRKSAFDPSHDYETLRLAAAHKVSAELERTWEAGKPYSSWVSDAARHAGI